MTVPLLRRIHLKGITSRFDMDTDRHPVDESLDCRFTGVICNSVGPAAASPAHLKDCRRHNLVINAGISRFLFGFER